MTTTPPRLLAMSDIYPPWICRREVLRKEFRKVTSALQPIEDIPGYVGLGPRNKFCDVLLNFW